MISKPVLKMKKFLSCIKRQGSQEERNEVQPPRRKMVIVGDGECGKTCLVTRMATGNFVDIGYVPTVFETEVINVHTGDEEVELVIFDTAGQEDYDRLRPFSYTDVDVVLICFSLADPDTLTNVMENWSPEIKYFCGDVPVILVGNKKDLRDSESSSSKSSSRASLFDKAPSDNCDNVSNKDGGEDDLKTESSTNDQKQTNVKEPPLYSNSTQRPVYKVSAPVKHSEGALSAKRIGAMAYFETSALTGDNVDELLLATTKASVLGSKKSKKFKPFADTLKSWKSLGSLAK